MGKKNNLKLGTGLLLKSLASGQCHFNATYLAIAMLNLTFYSLLRLSMLILVGRSSKSKGTASRSTEELNSFFPRPQNARTKMMQFSVLSLENQANILVEKKNFFS